MKYYIIAGEASGDLHGSNLIRGLRAEDPQAQLRFWGGDMMLDAAGGDQSQLVCHYKKGAVMGLTDVLGKIGSLVSNLNNCKKDILSWQPDVVILIDYPGFNMRIAQFCHKHGVKVFYYIAPKTWASREGRNRKLRAWVDKLYIVFPFEIPYFESREVPFVYEGNPLLDAVDNAVTARPAQERYIAILAGSRKGEIQRMMPVCMQVVDQLSALPQYKDCKFLVAGAPSRSEDDYTRFIGDRSDKVKLVFGQTYSVLKYAEAAIINSGTASLEAALIGTPQVVCWSTSKLSYALAKLIVKVKYISLGNLIVNRFAFDELIQDDFNPAAVVSQVRSLVEDADRREKMLSEYKEIRARLGGTGASRRVAASMIKEILNSH